jgi:hypothetical protein
VTRLKRGHSVWLCKGTDNLSDEFIPLFVTVLTIIGAAVTYAYQRIVDRKTALMELRRTAYREYLTSFMAMSNNVDSDKAVSNRFIVVETDFLVVGSDEVIKKAGALSTYYYETNNDRFNRDVPTTRRLVADVCKAMRADCFEKSLLTTAEIQLLVPIA